MPLLLALSVLLSASSDQTELPARPVSLAVPGLNVTGFAAEQASFFTEHLALQLKTQGFEVMTQREIQSMLGMERQKQLLGCSDAATSCMAELANALGSDALVLGDVGRVGDRIQVNLKALASGTGKTIAVFGQPARTEGEVLDVLSRGAAVFRQQLSKALNRAVNGSASSPDVEVSSAPKSSMINTLWWVPGAAGAVAAGVGTALLISGNGVAGQLKDKGSTLSDTEANALVSGGQTQQGVGVALLGVGAAAIAGSAVLFFLRDSGSTSTVTAVPTSQGAVVVWGGSL